MLFYSGLQFPSYIICDKQPDLGLEQLTEGGGGSVDVSWQCCNGKSPLPQNSPSEPAWSSQFYDTSLILRYQRGRWHIDTSLHATAMGELAEYRVAKTGCIIGQ